jgi:DNA replicative helicase MCM subunit Mcm2 (Cdc46/Mcm family)
LLIKLQHDLVDTCQPGDDVVVVGTLLSHWQHLVPMGDVQIGLVMDAHSIRSAHQQNHGGGDERHGSSSWDSIFNSRRDDDDDDDDDDDGGGNNGRRKCMVRSEIVKEFEDYWNEEENQKRPIAARNYICKAVCPSLYGLSLVKMALLLVLIGGSNDTDSDRDEGDGDSVCDNTKDNNGDTNEIQMQDRNGIDKGGNIENDSKDEINVPLQFSLDDENDELSSSIPAPQSHNSSRSKRRRIMEQDKKNETVFTRRREQSHLLLVGYPGCGKSQFLRFATALCPRSVLASGAGTTSAGLTCAAVRDEASKEWTLEAGALVLADRGVCAIDEFSCINPKDRTTIHEAMEQQTLSIAKAGIVAKLNCRATVIAVTNAKSGYYDHDKPFTVNVGIEPPLLSRFDLIFKLIDGSDAEKDDNIATFLLNRAIMVCLNFG